jgi:hypothetical protein
MKTIPFRFTFKNDGVVWSAEVFSGKEMIYSTVAVAPGCEKLITDRTIKPMADPHHTSTARSKMFAKLYSQTIKAKERFAGRSDDPMTFEEFKQNEIQHAQGMALDVAATRKIILAPENHVAEFWTAEHILRLSRVIQRPRRIGELHLCQWLCDNWENSKLYLLTRDELAKKVNAALHTSHKPAKIWQTAYRSLDLFTERKPGPKPGRPLL